MNRAMAALLSMALAGAAQPIAAAPRDGGVEKIVYLDTGSRLIVTGAHLVDGRYHFDLPGGGSIVLPESLILRVSREGRDVAQDRRSSVVQHAPDRAANARPDGERLQPSAISSTTSSVEDRALINRQMEAKQRSRAEKGVFSPINQAFGKQGQPTAGQPAAEQSPNYAANGDTLRSFIKRAPGGRSGGGRLRQPRR